MTEQVFNWGRSFSSNPEVVIKAQTADEIAAILKNKDQYPSPVRAVGSNHSTTRCATADGGTIIDMTQMNQILDIGTDTITAQAGALYIDVANELEKKGLQFFVNVELGNLTMGSASCGGTKDASMPDEFGQVCSYAIAIKLVTPAGEFIEVTEKDPELLQIMRSSYGLLGVIYEVTFRVHKLRPMNIYHETYTLDEFISRLPELRDREESMMLYLFPFLDKVTVEYRKYTQGIEFSTSIIWHIRNWVWRSLSPTFSYYITRFIAFKPLRYFLVDLYNQITQLVLQYLLKGQSTSPTKQIIRYPHEPGVSKYTFSIWGFSEAEYPDVLRGYFDFCKNHYQQQGYRCNMLNVGYRVFADKSSLFSYTYDGNVMTLDPVSTGDSGWDDFLDAFNAYCSNNGGIPLFNQTKSITRGQTQKAFGDRLNTFQSYRKQYDPEDRLLNDYFKQRIVS